MFFLSLDKCHRDTFSNLSLHRKKSDCFNSGYKQTLFRIFIYFEIVCRYARTIDFIRMMEYLNFTFSTNPSKSRENRNIVVFTIYETE